jgi:hypothetical protein
MLPPKRAMAARTDHGSGTTCEPMSSDCATTCESGANNPQEKSLASQIATDLAVRNTVARISRTTEIRAWVNTSSVIGSSVWPIIAAPE